MLQSYACTTTSPAASASVPTWGLQVQACADRRRMKRKNVCWEFWFQYAPSGHRCGGGRYHWYKDCTVRESLGCNFFVYCASPQQTPPFLSLNAETGFLQFKLLGPFKLTWKTPAIVHIRRQDGSIHANLHVGPTYLSPSLVVYEIYTTCKQIDYLFQQT